MRTGPGPLARLVRRIPPRAAIHTAIIVLIAGFMILGMASVDRYVKSLEQFQLRNLKLELPKWCPEELAQHLQSLSGGFGNTSIFDADVRRDVAGAYRRDPWVRKVIGVQAVLPDTLLVILDIRRPAYAVEKAGRYILVDPEGCVLPAKYGRWSDRDGRLQFIWGLRSVQPPPGRVWRDAALQGGIETLEVIANRCAISEQLTITGADVSNFDGVIDTNESDIEIITAGGCRILWGRPPSTAKFGEIPADAKLDHLEKILQQYPQPKGIKINVRFADAGGGIIMTDTHNAYR